MMTIISRHFYIILILLYFIGFCYLYSSIDAIAKKKPPSSFKQTTPKTIDIFQRRIKFVDEFCSMKIDSTVKEKEPKVGRLLVLKERNLVWCPVYKAGTSAWKAYLVAISQKSSSEKEKLVQKLLAKNPQTSDAVHQSLEMSRPAWKAWFAQSESSESSTRFLVVRHPFDRLVSVFRDKLERNNLYNGQWGYDHYGKDIVRLYRQKYLDRFGFDSLSKDNNYGAILPVTHGERTSKLPTFWEFIQWFLRENESHAYDHWTPIFDFCSMCAFEYNYILKFEHFAEESEEFMQSANLTQYLPDDKMVDFHKIVNNNHQTIPSTDITKLYFSVLSDEEIRQLFQIYQYDFQLFGYSFQFRNVTYS